MTLSEFFEKYYLHDSDIEAVEYDLKEKSLSIQIGFAFWMQTWYDEKFHPETGMIKAVFHNVKSYSCEEGNPAGKFVTILGIHYKEGTLVFVLDDVFSDDDCFDMIIEAESVDVFY